MSSLRGNPRTLRDLAKRIQTLPKVVAQDVAKRVAPKLTDLAQGAYGGGTTVYGDARPSGVGGKPLDLFVSGDTQREVRFVAIGTVVRAKLGTRYARFLIGKYRILPMGRLPVAWSQEIADAAGEEIRRQLGEVAA